MEQNDRKDRIGLDVDETQDQAHHESIDRQRRMSVQHGEERRREEQSRYDAVLGPHRLENDAPTEELFQQRSHNHQRNDRPETPAVNCGRRHRKQLHHRFDDDTGSQHHHQSPKQQNRIEAPRRKAQRLARSVPQAAIEQREKNHQSHRHQVGESRKTRQSVLLFGRRSDVAAQQVPVRKIEPGETGGKQSDELQQIPDSYQSQQVDKGRKSVFMSRLRRLSPIGCSGSIPNRSLRTDIGRSRGIGMCHSFYVLSSV